MPGRKSRSWQGRAAELGLPHFKALSPSTLAFRRRKKEAASAERETGHRWESHELPRALALARRGQQGDKARSPGAGLFSSGWQIDAPMTPRHLSNDVPATSSPEPVPCSASNCHLESKCWPRLVHLVAPRLYSLVHTSAIFSNMCYDYKGLRADF